MNMQFQHTVKEIDWIRPYQNNQNDIKITINNNWNHNEIKYLTSQLKKISTIKENIINKENISKYHYYRKYLNNIIGVNYN